MKFDFMRVITAITRGMIQVEKIKNAKGAEKLQAVLESIPEFTEAVEFGIDKDIMNDAKVLETATQAIASIKAFHNAVAAAKLIKNPPPPVG